MAAIYSLYIINKSGGLIFYKDCGTASRMDTNDSLRLASLWHSMHAISQQLSPVNGCTGIDLLQADTFDLHCFQSLTGTKFFVVCEPGTLHMEELLKHIYELYTDYVLKNPSMRWRCPLGVNSSTSVFHRQYRKIVSSYWGDEVSCWNAKIKFSVYLALCICKGCIFQIA